MSSPISGPPYIQPTRAFYPGADYRPDVDETHVPFVAPDNGGFVYSVAGVLYWRNSTGETAIAGESGPASFPQDILVHTAIAPGVTVGLGAQADSRSTAVGVGALGHAAVDAMFENTALGYHALHNANTGSENTAVGDTALEASTTGTSNTALGASCLPSLTTGAANTAAGAGAGDSLIDGSYNIFIGAHTFLRASHGDRNTAVGAFALQTDGTNGTFTANTAIGYGALTALTGDATGNVALGAFAGFYAVSSNEFYVNNQDRTDTAGDKAESLLYGLFDALAANQRLRINAFLSIGGAFSDTSPLNVTGLPTSAVGLVAGDVWNNAGVLTIV